VGIIAVKTLKDWCVLYPKAKQSLLAWHEEAISAEWNNPNELKSQFQSASIISDKRVIFNIHGNSFRLIVDIEYRLKIVFIVWFGTHQEYDRIDTKIISYAKANKK
jgi:mRNA interferase HigB